jgi:hydroxymethylbilane synthase
MGPEIGSNQPVRDDRGFTRSRKTVVYKCIAFHSPLYSLTKGRRSATNMTSTGPALASSTRTFTLASRASQLAQIQTNIVLASLQAHFPPPSDGQHGQASGPLFTTSFMATAGDKNQSQALYLQGGKALWTKELEVVLKEGTVDMVIHSLKDVPTTLPDGCVIGAILEREDPVDSLVVKGGKSWKSLEDLPEGSVVGTSSVRRVAQLRRNFPGLKFLDVVRFILD